MLLTNCSELSANEIKETLEANAMQWFSGDTTIYSSRPMKLTIIVEELNDVERL